MATITGTPTLAQIEGTIRKDFFRKFLVETGLGAIGTATGGTTATIIDTTRLKSSQYDTKDHVGGWARISYDAGGAGAAPEGEQNPVTAYDPSTGTITVNPLFTIAPAVNDLYELWHNVNPADAKDILDGILANDLFMPCWTMLTEMPDGDMEQNNTTDWVGVNANITKDTSEPAMYGKRHLRVTTTAPNGYARNANNLLVDPGTQYHVSVLARGVGDATTVTLQAWDASNNVLISSMNTTHQFPARIHFEFQTPATCEKLQIRMLVVQNASSADFDELVIYPTASQDIRLPWWVKHRNQVLGIFQMSPTSIENGVWDANLAGEADRRWYIQDNYRGQLRIQSRQDSIGSMPLFILGLRNETAYTDDNTDKKYIDPNLMLSAFGYKIYNLLYQKNINNQVQATKMREMRDTFYKSWKQFEGSQLEALNRIFAQTTTPDMLIDDDWARFSYGRR